MPTTELKERAWVLRWDTEREEKPRVLQVNARGFLGASVFEAESGDFVVFDGYLFDRAELGTRPEEPDAALVAGAYLRWGEALCDKLRGAFTLGVWDSERRVLLVGRDAVGLSPCFYHWDGRVFLMSSSLDTILVQPEVEATVNRVVMAEYLLDAPTSCTETFYEGIKRLPSAHSLSVSQRRLMARRYWDPVPPRFAWASREEMGRFPDLLARSVRRCLESGTDCLGLSGGFDSIGLAALAADQSAGGHPLHALSLRFVHPDCDEGERQIAVARALGMPLLMLTVEETLGRRSLLEAGFALSAGSPCPLFSAWQPAYEGLLQSAKGLGLGGLMMGSGGDDLLCVSLSYAEDCLVAGDVRRLWNFYQACRQTSPETALLVARVVFWHWAIRPALRRLARRVLGALAPESTERLRQERRRRAVGRWWLSCADPRLIETLQDRRANPLPIAMAPGEGSYVRVIRRLTQAPMLQLALDQGSWFARSTGFREFLPYFDRDVVDLLLRFHPDHLIEGGYHKAPLRRLVGERLPMLDARAKKISAARMFREVMRSQGRMTWRDLGGPRMLARLELVQPRRVDAFMDDFFTERNDNALLAWLFLSTEMWLQARAGVRRVALNGGLRHG